MIKDNSLPTQQELIQMNKCGLANAINRFGSLYQFAKDLGCKVKKLPNGYWNIDTIFEAIENQIGFFATPDELIAIDRHDLVRAISRNGGFIKLRSLFELKKLEKPTLHS